MSNIINVTNHLENSRSFGSIFEDLNHKSCMTYHSLRTLYMDAVYAGYLDGDFAECGCWEGGSSYLLASLLRPEKKLFVLDSFKGLSPPTEEDLEYKDFKGNLNGGEFAVPQEKVSKFLSKFGKQVKIIPGFFSETLVTNIDDELFTNKFSLVHMDVDLYQPYKECIEFFYPRMVDRGLMIFDEYQFLPYCPGAAKAINDFLSTIEFVGYQYASRLTVVVHKGGGT